MDAWRDGPSLSTARSDFGFVSDGVRLFAIAGESRCIFCSFFQLFYFELTLLRSPINTVEVFDSSVAVGDSDAQWLRSEATSIYGTVRAIIF